MSRRFAQHAGQKGAKYFRARQPERLIYIETGHSRSSAGKREMAIKKLTRLEKLRLIAAESNPLALDANGSNGPKASGDKCPG